MRHLFRKEPPFISIPPTPAREEQNPSGTGEGLWVRCENERCHALLYVREFEKNLKVCHKCEHHARLSARERIEQLADEGSFREHDGDLLTADPLNFEAPGQVYLEKVAEYRERTGETEAAVAGFASLDGRPCELVVLDLQFIGGSMGSVVGEKIVRAADRAGKNRSALITVNASGGARQQEGILSLMQMAKTVTALAQLGQQGVPHISVLTDPALAGVLASYAGIGDVTIGEKGAVAGFAGRRVIEQTTHQKLPPDAQTAEFLLEHGMVDMVLHRRELRPMLARLVHLYGDRTVPHRDASRRNGRVAAS